MAGYSKENQRQNQALQTILDGGTPEKRIFVSMEDVDEKNKDKNKSRKTEKSQVKGQKPYQPLVPLGFVRHVKR